MICASQGACFDTQVTIPKRGYNLPQGDALVFYPVRICSQANLRTDAQVQSPYSKRGLSPGNPLGIEMPTQVALGEV